MWTQLLGLIKGRKTIGLGAALIVYLLISAVTGQETDQNIINAILASMGIALRMGMANDTPRSP